MVKIEKTRFYAFFCAPSACFELAFTPNSKSELGVDNNEGTTTVQVSTSISITALKNYLYLCFSRPNHLLRIKPHIQNLSRSDVENDEETTTFQVSTSFPITTHKNYLYLRFSRLNLDLFPIEHHSNSKSE